MRLRTHAACAAVLAAGLAVVSVLLAMPAAAASAWWNPVAFRGASVSGVSADGKTIIVQTTAGTTLRSDDGGATFVDVAGNPPLASQAVVLSGNDTWLIGSDGRVLHAHGKTAAREDPQSPDLGSSAHLIAAPAATPGVVVAVATDGTVWRRGQDGDWARAFLLLPQGFPRGVPAVTSLTAFAKPLSSTVYLGTDGYSVLISTNGGDDWIRAGPGLPDSVYALATDAATRSVYAGTSDGLWVHTLQAFPTPPMYKDAALVWRWIGIALVTIAASVLTVLALARLITAPARRR